MFSDQPLKINIELSGPWYEWEITYKDRRLEGMDRELKDCLDAVLEASARIMKPRLNPPRNP
jgi:hypothetical protein